MLASVLLVRFAPRPRVRVCDVVLVNTLSDESELEVDALFGKVLGRMHMIGWMRAEKKRLLEKKHNAKKRHLEEDENTAEQSHRMTQLQDDETKDKQEPLTNSQE